MAGSLVPGALRSAIRNGLGALGYQVVRAAAHAPGVPTDIARDARFLALLERCRPFTMTSVERMYALYQAVGHVSRAGIAGAVVECGVWRGGSAMLCALALLEGGDTERDLYLYDTFEGMAKPDERDVSHEGEVALETWSRSPAEDGGWCYSPIDEVRRNLLGTGYPEARLHFVKGKVEDTLPGTIPAGVALLRLDTDWYASTRHELEHLYPRLAPGGVLIVDDYGFWEGARQATDEFLDALPSPLLLGRIDDTGRIAVKPGR
ncbi:MAG: hypothetical protein JWM27_1797 [Gemmatimonadetes bacterium]|nr:hypothetical protein [Gemmatimonadota bacterium]